MPDFIIGDPSGVARKLTNIVVGDASGIARDLKELWIGDASGVPRKIFSKGIITMPVGTVNHTVGFPTDASAGISFREDGSLQYNVDNTTLIPNWFTPTTPAIGASYWIRATLSGGSTPSSGSMGVWLQLNTPRSWGNLMTGAGVRTSVILFELSADAGGSVIASGTVTIEAESS